MFNVVSGDTIFTNEIEVRLTTAPERRPGALLGDNYAIGVINNGKASCTCSKDLNETDIFLSKNGGKVHFTVTGPKRYSVDLKRGELELAADFCFTLLNEKLFLQMKEKTSEEVQKYEKRKKKLEQEKEKKKKKKLKKEK